MPDLDPSSTPSQELITLKTQRKSAKGNISRIKNQFDGVAHVTNLIDLELRLDMVKGYTKQLLSYQTEIEKIDPTDTKRAELEELCIATQTKLKTLMGGTRRPSAYDANMSVAFPPQCRLPNIKLPKFEGKYSEYTKFMSRFTQKIHEEHSLSNSEKFEYLLSCLAGEALNAIQSFQVTDENYPKALQLLNERYNNKCLIFSDSIDEIFNLPSMQKPNATALRETVDKVTAMYESLLSIGTDTEIVSALLIHIVMSKVDSVTRIKWNDNLDYATLPSWNSCAKELIRRCQSIKANSTQSTQSNPQQVQNSNPRFARNTPFPKTILSCTQATKTNNCNCCNKAFHPLYQCDVFNGMTINKRFEFVKCTGQCLNCLRKGHSANKCQSSKCRICFRAHHSLLHRTEPQQSHICTVGTPSANNDDQPSTSAQASSSLSSFPAVMTASGIDVPDITILATAVVRIQDAFGSWHTARALLDSGSQISCITNSLSKTLSLKKEAQPVSVCGFANSQSTLNHRVHTSVRSTLGDFKFNAELWVLPSIVGYIPNSDWSIDSWSIPSDIVLADPLFNKRQKVDMLLGADVFYDVISAGKLALNNNAACIQNTRLGWIIAGRFKPLPTVAHVNTAVTAATDHHAEPFNIDSWLPRFWELEEVEIKTPRYSPEQQDCEKHFIEHISRLPNGKFSVRLPFKQSPLTLGMSFETARRRFLSLERRLEKTPQTRQMYTDFMLEYIKLKHMSIVTGKLPASHYYIPHQVVLKPTNETTKLRVVFDASSKTNTNLSLNDTLMVGPTIQPDLYSLLLKFRSYKYVISADIVKMYRQFEIDERDRMYQLIVWRESSNLPIQTYQLNTVTYGTAPAPFLATRCLLELSKVHARSHPVGAEVLANEFYVDDMLTGAHDLVTLHKKRAQVVEIMAAAGMELAKWKSNVPWQEDSQLPLELCLDEYTKSLGIMWHPQLDVWSYKIELDNHDAATKRNILSIAARLFDPLGLICPIITCAKILLQELWLQKLDWDESIPPHLKATWTNIVSSLRGVGKITIPRHVGYANSSLVQIHGFCDASLRAYGFCVYVRTQEGECVTSRLLTAKSRVAPIKTKSIPRLELCAAHLLAKWWKTHNRSLPAHNDVIFWSDSEITLLWLKRHPALLVSFVANRVSDVQEWSQGIQWRHVRTGDNPADLVSRGCDIDTLTHSSWFNGPMFLCRPVCEWPTHTKTHTIPEDKLELRKSTRVLTTYVPSESIVDALVNRWSSYPKILRIMSYIYRFTDSKGNKSKDVKVTVAELQFAWHKMIQLIQQKEFAHEIQCVKDDKLVRSAKVQRLNPFLHNERINDREVELLRVGGRLCHAPLPYNARFPILVTSRHELIKVFVRYLHITNCHAGPKALVALLRQQIWVINARQLARSVVRKCVHCFRYKPILANQIMGDLPPDRLTTVRAFAVCGVDFCGPIYTTLKIRGRPPYKTYLAVFVCFATKAVHIEPVSDLSTDSFLLSFKRFIGRRGCPTKVFCDNGTNFVGASGALEEMKRKFMSKETQDKMHEYTTMRGIEFQFIPPRAPHFGGLWEAAVKTAKYLLLRAVGHASLTFEELATVATDVEAILNSRPLVSSEDPNEGDPITPAHFLVGGTLQEVVGVDHAEHTKTQYKRWRALTALKARFWSAFQKEYVASLQQRAKWSTSTPNIIVDTVVLVHDDNAPPQQWTLGRVTAVKPGIDGRIRVVDVATTNGVIRRPVAKIAPLPLDAPGHT